MSDAVFPSLPGLAIEVTRTVLAPPVTIRTTPSQREYRARDAVYPRYRYGVRWEVLRAGAEAELQTIVGFFNQRGGSFDNFLFPDPDDYKVAAQAFGVGDGSAKEFQLVRSFGGFVEPVYGLNGAPTLFVNGVLKSTGYSVDATGLVTFTSAPAAAAVLTWTGNYYQRVRFERDQAEFERFLHQLWNGKRCELITDKP